MFFFLFFLCVGFHSDLKNSLYRKDFDRFQHHNVKQLEDKLLGSPRLTKEQPLPSTPASTRLEQVKASGKQNSGDVGQMFVPHLLDMFPQIVLQAIAS